MGGRYGAVLAGLAVLVLGTGVRGEDAEADANAARRGEKALLTRSFTPPTLPLSIYEKLWKQWESPGARPPADYARAVEQRYGLHPAPYPNDGYPMGLRLAPALLGGKALSVDCMVCHGGSIFGQSHVGLGNSTLDFQTFVEDVSGALGQKGGASTFTSCNVRGTSEAGAMAVYLLGLREPDLKLRSQRLDLGLHDDMCEDTPAWWLLRKKKTMYWTGGADTRSVRSIMQFMMSPLNTPSSIKKEEATFADIRAYLLSMKPPKYPLAVDGALARKGQAVFEKTCARCHGTYGEQPTYPNKVVPLAEIGTDPRRFQGITKEFGEYYNRSWFAQGPDGGYKALPSDGYQAPPLDGLWATAPYFHNGSAPTVYHVLNSAARPQVFTRSYTTGREAYDSVRLGWQVQVPREGPDPALPAVQRRKVYDTRQPGRSNGGHTYGDRLSEEERMAVIEYLKTL